MRPPSAVTSAETSRQRRDFPIPGGPVTVIRCGRVSDTHRLQSDCISSSSRERPTRTFEAIGRSAGASEGSIASHAVTGSAFPLASTDSDCSYRIACRVARYVSAPTISPPGGAADWRRDAVLTTSPVAERVPASRIDGDDGLAGVHGRARGKVERMLAVQLVDALEHAQARANRALGIVTVRNGRPEDGHHRIADELLQHAPVVLDPALRLRVVELKRFVHVFGIGLRCARGGTDQVDEEDGNELALLARRARLQRRPATAAEAGPLGILLTAVGAGTRTLFDGSLEVCHLHLSLALEPGHAKGAPSERAAPRP